MLLAQIDLHPTDFPLAVETAVNILQGVLTKSVSDPLLGTNEINLVQSKSVIESPPLKLKATIIQ